jgi:hypothetical protein
MAKNPIEDQVQIIGKILHSLGSDPTWQPQGDFHRVMPCSFSELDAWTSRMPDPEVHRTLEEVLSRMSFINHLAILDPNDLDGMSDISDDDPRLPGFIAQLSEKWPSSAKIAEITNLYGCVTRTIQQIAKVRPNLPTDSPMANGFDNAAKTLRISSEDIAMEMGLINSLLEQLRNFVPDVPKTLRIVNVSSPEINRIFSLSSTVTVNDNVAPLAILGGIGEGFFQSRYGSPGEEVTTGDGMTTYLYRINLSEVVGDVGVKSLDLGFVSPATLNLSEAGVNTDGEIFVITHGGLGTIGPTEAKIIDNRLKLIFDTPLLAGGDSFFFGFASLERPGLTRAIIVDLVGNSYEIDIIAPVVS